MAREAPPTNSRGLAHDPALAVQGANLSLAHLGGAILLEAHLEGANLIGARLEGANLREAHLEGANLREAHLEGATLREANLERASLGDAISDLTTVWPSGFDPAEAGVRQAGSEHPPDSPVS